MLLQTLLLRALLLLPLLAGGRGARTDIPRDSSYVLRQNVSCPDSGFFLQRDLAKFPAPDECHLCFCKSNASAVCWRRMNRGCDLESYQDLGKSISRARRSPLNFGDVFVRDATREFFTKQSAEQCKPFESSFSDGCPPVDWCVGCTVCDCDANGHWDCHILSFCADKNGQKQMKKRREHPKNRVVKRQSKKSTTNASRYKKNIRKPSKTPIRKQPGKPIIKRNQSSENNKHRINQVKSSKVHKYVPVKKSLPNDVKAKKAISNRNKVTSRPMVKKRAATNKAVSINSNKHKTIKNNTIDVAQSVVKQYVTTTMQKMTRNIERPTNSSSKQVNKLIHKLPKQQKKKTTNEADNKRKLTANPTSKGNNNNNNKFKDRNIPELHDIHKYGRMKRQIAFTERSPGIIISNDSSKEGTVNNRETLGKENKIQNLLGDHNTPIINIVHHFNNETFSLTQLNNVTSPDIYKITTRINKENQGVIVKDDPFHHNLSNTQSAVLMTTNNYNSQQKTSIYNNDSFTTVPYNELTRSKQIIIDTTEIIRNKENQNENSDNKILQLRKQFFNISAQTEHHNCMFKTLLQKITGIEPDRYNYTEKSFEFSKRPKKYTILNKFKRLFRKVFNKNNKLKLHHKDNLYYGDNDTEQKSVYKEFRQGKLDSKQKEKLVKNLNELKTESYNILSSVRIIKGLLYLLGNNTNDTKHYISNKSYDLNENMNKLKAIVNNKENQPGEKLTEVQQIQINYIKSNVEVFIKSLWKFTNILDDVAQIAMYHNKGQNRFNSSKIINNNGYHSNKNFIIRNSTKKKLEKIKNLIINYKLLQNKFINDIYVILNNFKNKDSNNQNLGHNNMLAKTFTKLNNTDTVEINSVNILKNIRKLKFLAEKLSNVQKRQKRETVGDDDALEYILILMEYLLKRNAPAKDGIDLLIEAINNAPDIKLVRKKVLDNETHKTFATRTTTLKNYSDNDKDFSFSNEETKEKNISLNDKKTTTKTEEQSQDVDDDDSDKIEEIYRAFRYNNGENSGQTQDKVLSTNEVIPATIESYYNIKDEAITPQTFKGDKEELTSSNSETMDIETTSPPSVTGAKNAIIFEENNKKGDNLPVDVEDNTDRIENNLKNVKQSRTVDIKYSTPSALAATRTHRHKHNPSDVTNENESYSAKIAENASAEEVVSRKQIDLLNSLDYVRENDVDDEIDSKGDKFPNDFE